MLSSFVLLSSLLYAVSAKVLLSDGTSMQRGTLSDILKWQSSGLLYQGCDNPRGIADCYTLELTSDPTKELDPGYPTPRQRIEFRSPNQADGVVAQYTWKHYLDPSVGTTSHFFHLMQVFSTGDGGPIVTLDAVSGKAMIKDYARSCAVTKCPSMDLSAYEGRVTLHSMTVMYGPKGKLRYVVSDADSGQTLLTYTVGGAMGTGGSYAKFGTYREAVAGMSNSSAQCGDFTMKILSQ